MIKHNSCKIVKGDVRENRRINGSSATDERVKGNSRETTGRTYITFHLSNPKHKHTPGGSGRGGSQWRRRAGRSKAGQEGSRRNGSPRKQLSLVSSKASSTTIHNDSSEPRMSEKRHKLTEEENLTVPKTGHTTGGSCRGGAWQGGADPGKVGRRRVGSPRRQPSLVPPRAWRTKVLNDFSEARKRFM